MCVQDRVFLIFVQISKMKTFDFCGDERYTENKEAVIVMREQEMIGSMTREEFDRMIQENQDALGRFEEAKEKYLLAAEEFAQAKAELEAAIGKEAVESDEAPGQASVLDGAFVPASGAERRSLWERIPPAGRGPLILAAIVLIVLVYWLCVL